jgi:hypothetical protein
MLDISAVITTFIAAVIAPLIASMISAVIATGKRRIIRDIKGNRIRR